MAQTVLITGASSGLGAALFSVFSVLDGRDRVIGTSPSEDGVNIPWDAMVLTDTDRLVAALPPKIDVLINNAGINAIRKFEDLDSAFIHDIFQVNCVAPVLLTRALLASERLQRGAVVCNVISDAAWRPMRHSLAYNCSKAAFDMATKQMARELTKPYGLTVFGVRPGKMRGTGMSKYIDDSVRKMRGWSKEEADHYFCANAVAGEDSDPVAIAQLIWQFCGSRLPLSGACIDLVG